MSDPAIAAPVAAPEAATTPEAAPAKLESFRDAWQRLGGANEALETDAGEALAEPTEEAEAAPEPEKPAKGKKTVDPKGDEHSKLTELAKKLGYELEGGKLLPSEVAKFRDWRRQRKAETDAEYAKRMGELTEKEKQHGERLSKADKLEKAAAEGDYEGLAKLLGHDDWNKLQEAVIARISDPNYKKMRELEQWKLDQEKREKEQAEQAELTKKQQKQQQAQAEYIRGLQQTMSQSKDPLLAALHDEPVLFLAVHRIQAENWDGENVPPPERVLNMAAKGAKFTLKQDIERLYQKLHKALGKPEQAAPPAAKKPAPRSAPVPPSSGVEARGPGKWRDPRDPELRRYTQSRLAEAIEKDRREGT